MSICAFFRAVADYRRGIMDYMLDFTIEQMEIIAYTLEKLAKGTPIYDLCDCYNRFLACGMGV